LGALGKVFGVNLTGTGKADGSTAGSALWVRWANGGPLGGTGVSGVAGGASGVIGGLLGGSEATGSGAAAASQSGGGAGILGGLFGSIAGLFGRKASVSPQQSVASPTFPTRAAGVPNELADLVASASPTTTDAVNGAPVQSIPTLLRRVASGAVLGASLLGTPAAANQATQGPDTVLPALQAEAASPLGAPSEPNKVIPSPPEAQQRIITEITHPKPSLFDKILGAAINFGGQIAGGWAAGMVPQGGDTSGGGGGDNSWALAPSPNDNVNDAGIVTMPMAFGGKVSGRGSGTSDSIPAMLSHGEFVTKASSTAKHLPLLHRINNDTLKFAVGGLVGYDDGGYVSPSAAYMPGERGMGMMAAASTRIAGSTSSSSVSTRNYGDTHNHYIDARGSTDPAQTTANIDRYMKTAGPQIAAAAVHAVKDQQMRRAPSAK
jgi:hypothetical protein